MPCFTATVNCFVFSFFTESGFSRPEILIHSLKKSRKTEIICRARLTSFLNDDRNNPRQGGQSFRLCGAPKRRSGATAAARRSSAQRLRRAWSETVSKVSEGRVIRDPDSSNASENGGSCNSPSDEKLFGKRTCAAGQSKTCNCTVRPASPGPGNPKIIRLD